MTTTWASLLRQTAEHAVQYVETVHEHPVDATATPTLPGRIPALGEPPEAVIDDMVNELKDGLVASTGPRFFGWVVGGAHPVSIAADWLTSTWDQLATSIDSSPAAAVVEETTLIWLKDLLNLPAEASAAFVTGAQMANFTSLAAARHAVLREAGWDVERDGLIGAPRITVIAGRERHITIDGALRFLGLGTACIVPVDVDDQGRIDPAAFASAMDTPGPKIVCLGAGNVNTGAFDHFTELIPIAHRHGAWVHVDGAFGLWAAAAPSLRHLTAGAELADSWAVDMHKWLNVPYDSAIAVIRDKPAHLAALSVVASYVQPSTTDSFNGSHLSPEFSRRARAFPVYALLRTLGRQGVSDLIERCCDLARYAAEELSKLDGITIVNDVVLNQVLVRFDRPEETARILQKVRKSGEAFFTASTWNKEPVMRLAISNWQTTRADVVRSIDALRR